MTHEPEYKGIDQHAELHDPPLLGDLLVVTKSEHEAALRAAYRRGFNDHAASRAHAEAVYGTYPMSDRLGTFDRSRWNQHGKGENP